MKINHYFFILLSLGLSSCQKKTKPLKQEKIITIADFPKVNLNQDFVGTYKGILPCTDCEGMETMIILNENNTYTKSVHYLGKGTKIFEQKGMFNWNESGNCVILEAISNAPNRYVVTKSKIIQLDMEGNFISGSFAKEYELTKQSNQLSEIESSEMEGNKVNLNNKLESTASVEHVNPAEGKYTLAKTKWELVKLNGEIVKRLENKVNFIKMNSSDGKFSAFTGCNQIFGSYAMPSINKISFTEIGSTRMYCPGSMIESDFLNMLEGTTSYRIDEENLTFYGSTKVPIAIFVAVK